ncbi:hypothetical protein NADFUDRAFT_84573 [Nadsonia fulvescens var. elongata DSM 6958]|uniref:Cytochrome b-c1 complex subunit 8 n=1 Tax=Nadsonia fulvescens var. elongata DSM 6958 TaxID=857566 RepID=A0A1E3PDY6_9ASCO|nr:hypothetical protein NADFUDRAFT_84573 [Nadsonia fulvescens var. elongata DSM 6958]
MAAHPTKQVFMGWWGYLGSPAQKGINRYSVSSYAQKPFAGAAHAAVFNTFRRVKGSTLMIVVPSAIFYYIWTKANEKNEWLYSKAGREELEKLSG